MKGSRVEEYQRALLELRAASRAYRAAYGENPYVRIVVGNKDDAKKAELLEHILNRLANS